MFQSHKTLINFRIHVPRLHPFHSQANGTVLRHSHKQPISHAHYNIWEPQCQMGLAWLIWLPKWFYCTHINIGKKDNVFWRYCYKLMQIVWSRLWRHESKHFKGWTLKLRDSYLYLKHNLTGVSLLGFYRQRNLIVDTYKRKIHIYSISQCPHSCVFALYFPIFCVLGDL